MPEVSALPTAARQKLEAMQAAAGDTQPPATPPADTTPPATPPADTTPPAPPAPVTPTADTPAVERVTLTREELNELRAAAGTANTQTARLEEAEARNEALLRRLTELEASHKGNPNPPAAPAPAAPPAPAVEIPEATFSDDENERFGDSREYIEKLARNVFAKLFAPIASELKADLARVRESSTDTSKAVEDHRQAIFNRDLLAAVPNLKELVRNQHWVKFLDEVDELTGSTMEAILGKHIQARSAEKAAKIYKRFEEKYIKPIAADTGAYAGATPSGGAVTTPQEPTPKAKLKLSDRTKASKDYISGKITYEQLQEVNAKFIEAEKAGNVDHNS